MPKETNNYHLYLTISQLAVVESLVFEQMSRRNTSRRAMLLAQVAKLITKVKSNGS